MHRAAVLIIGLITLATGPAAAGEDAEAFFAAGLGAASVPEEMGRQTEGSIENGAPPASGSGSVGTATDPDTGGPGMHDTPDPASPPPTTPPPDGKTCSKETTGTACTTYRDGRLVKRCVRSGRGPQMCTFFDADGRAIRRCTVRRAHRRCVRLSAAEAPSVGEPREPGSAGLTFSPLVSTLSWQGWPSHVVRQVGKIFFTRNGRKSACSGTVVSRTLVLTAGHCVYGQGAFDSRLVFTPGMTWDPTNPQSYQHPYGTWEAHSWWVPQAYVDGDGSSDYGLVEFGPQKGQFIGDVVGSWNITTGIAWNAGTRIYMMGYPASGYWATADGHYGLGQYACDSRYDNEYNVLGKGYELRSKCTMNGGASGGPWFVLVDGKWTIGGVNDQCYGPNMGTDHYCQPYSYYLRSAFFDGRFMDFWRAVDRLRTW